MFFVAMTINGSKVDSSAVFNGTEKQCAAVAKRLSRNAHPSVAWIVVSCL